MESNESAEWINENRSRLFRLDAFLVNFNELLHKHETFYKALAEIRRLCDRALAEYGEREPEFGGGYSPYEWSMSRKAGGKMTGEERLVREAGGRGEVAEDAGRGDAGEPRKTAKEANVTIGQKEPKPAPDRLEGFELYTNGGTLVEAMPITYGDYAMGRDPAADAAKLARKGYVTRCWRRDGFASRGGWWIEEAAFEAEWSPIGRHVARGPRRPNSPAPAPPAARG